MLKGISPSIHSRSCRIGAYIIVSSRHRLRLTDRRNAMKEAVADLPNAAELFLDFYERQRVATWIRDHPALVPWVRSLVGRSIPGWRSYGAWSYAPDAENDAYLLDDAVRIYTGGRDSDKSMSAGYGIQQIREELYQPSACRALRRAVGNWENAAGEPCSRMRLQTRLAATTLQEYSAERDGKELILVPERLARSFSRRLERNFRTNAPQWADFTKPCRRLGTPLMWKAS